MTGKEMRAACRKAVEDIAADPDALAKLPGEVRRQVVERAGADAAPWTMERLRAMTRQQFRECEKRGDLPPVELAVQLVSERLGMRVEREKRR